jgi:hypothetical protein
MSGALLAVLAAIAGALITASATAAVTYYQRASAFRDAHRARAFERHLTDYERIFLTTRSVLDSLNDYVAVNRSVTNRSDPFLQQLLEILADRAYEYCTAVDWRHNQAMAYLDMELEKKCLRLRDLLLSWLSKERLVHGDTICIRQGDQMEIVSPEQVKMLRVGSYRELRVERQTIAIDARGDVKLISDIRTAGTRVIKDLKAVMAH